MMNMKKLLALLLAVVMVVGMFPVSAAAEGEETTCATCGSTEHIEHPAENPAPVDNCDNCDDETCTGCNGGADPLADGGEETPEPRQSTVLCAQCNATEKNEDGTVKHNEGCETLKPAVLCDKCSATEANEDGTVKHNEGCETLKPAVLCEKCNATEKNEDGTVKHNEGCETMKPAVLCEKCNATEKNEDGTVKHNEGCETLKPAVLCEKCNATEKNEDGTVKHNEGCETLKPAVLCEKCNATEKNEDGTVKHTETCETLCTCTPIDGVHQGECIFAPVVENAGPQVGDKIWIKSGSKVYKNMNDNRGHTLILNYHVTIESIEYNEEGAATWYKFSPAVNWFGKYEYVKVENTTEEKPDEVIHDGSVTVTTEDGKSIQADGIPKNAALQVAAADASAVETISAHIGDTGTVETVFAYDITIVDENGDEWQPGDEPVKVTLTIPNLTMGFYQKLQVAHLHEGEVKMVENVEMDLEKDTISFTTDGFSTFVGSFVDFSSSVKNSIMLTPGTAEALVDILEAIAPETYLKYDVSTDVESVSVSPENCGITWNSSYAITAGDTFGNTEATLTVNMKAVDGIEAKTYTIRVLCGDRIFGLKGAHKNWNGDGTYSSENITITGEDLGTYDVFDQAIYSTDTTMEYKPDSNDVQFGGNYKVYLRPGMAITLSDRIFLKNPKTNEVMTSWNTTKYHSGDFTFDGWTLIYDNEEGDKLNYVIAQDVTEYTVCRIEIRDADATSTDVRYIELHIIPGNDPMLLRTYLGSRTDYTIKEVPVTLFDYDGREWNDHYSNGNTTNVAMGFHSADGGKNALVDDDGKSFTFNWAAGNDGVDSSGRNAKQGIMQSSLVNGLPVMAQGSGVDLFSTTSIGNAKKVHQNVGFEFIYDSDGYYTYNSELNHAQYKEFQDGTKKIELYTQSMSPSDSNNITYNWADQNAKAGFYPFADINEAFISVDATGMTVEDKLARLKTGVDDNNRLNGDLVKDFVSTATKGSTVGMYFGLSITSDFYLPKDKKLNGQDMIYEFTGDDDLWVFIDGQLVLDIGGGHTPVSGSFNLTTGEVWVEYFSQLDADHGGYYASLVSEEKLDKVDLLNDEFFKEEETFLQELDDDQMHTISIFYLERYSGESNCRMRFNLPLVPSESVHVSKNLVNQDNQELSVTPDVDYTFTLYTAAGNNDIIDATNFTPYANESYTVMGSGAPSGTQTTDANGQFKLKDGWTASFAGIERFTEVYVVESEPNDDYIYTTKGMISVNKATATEYEYGEKSETKVMQLNSSINFDFVNKMQTQPLTVEKQVVNGTAGLIKSDQKFDFDIVFTKDCLEASSVATTGNVTSIAVSDKETENDDTVHLGGTFQLGHNESVTIPRVPVNMTYTLKEVNPDSTYNSFDAPAFESTTCTTTDTPNAFDTAYTWTMVDGAENKVKVTNQQRFDLTISKQGILPVDHDDEETQTVEEHQSTIYTVVGKNGEDEQLVEMEVAICGNDSVTIKKLPVGSYTVTEDENWSWRYTPEGDVNKNVTIPLDAKAAVTFKNKRDKQYWLSGDCHAKNLWTRSGIDHSGLVTPNGN